jgi:Mago binding
MARFRSSRFSASNRSSRSRSVLPPVRASSRMEADFFPLDRLARAIPLIEGSPRISWLQLHSPCPRPRMRRHPATSTLNRICAVENDSNRRFNMRATCNEENAQYGCSIPHRIITSCNRVDGTVRPAIHVRPAQFTFVLRSFRSAKQVLTPSNCGKLVSYHLRDGRDYCQLFSLSYFCVGRCRRSLS